MSLYNLIEKKRKEKRKKIVRTATISTLVAGTAGVLSGVLLAPKSGKDTRKDIKGKVNELKVITIDQSKNLKSNVQEAKSKIKEYLIEKNKKGTVIDEEVIIDETENNDNNENTEENNDVE